MMHILYLCAQSTVVSNIKKCHFHIYVIPVKPGMTEAITVNSCKNNSVSSSNQCINIPLTTMKECTSRKLLNIISNEHTASHFQLECIMLAYFSHLIPFFYCFSLVRLNFNDAAICPFRKPSPLTRYTFFLSISEFIHRSKLHMDTHPHARKHTLQMHRCTQAHFL